MESIIDIMRALRSFSPGESVSENEVADAERELELLFSEEYKQYLIAFGAMDAYSIELTGFTDDEELHVVSATKAAWEYHDHVPRNLYLIEDAAFDGILIWQDSSGNIYESTPSQTPRIIFSSLAEYVKRVK